MASKPSRPLSNSLRIFIVAGSVGAFFGGWTLLAHSPNPYDNAQATALDAPVSDSQNNALPPLPTPRARNSQNFQQTAPQPLQPNTQLAPNLQSQQPFGSPFGSTFRQRRMRSGGS